jgi:hypothetical protein
MVVIIVLSMSNTIVSTTDLIKSNLTFNTSLDRVFYLRDVSKVDRLRCGFFLAGKLFLHGDNLLWQKKHGPFLSNGVVLAYIDILVVLFLLNLIEQVILEVGLRHQRVSALDDHFFHKAAHIYHYFHVRRLLLSSLVQITIFILLRELFVFFTI